MKLEDVLANAYRYRKELRAILREPDARDVDEVARAVIGWGGYFLTHQTKQLAPAIIRRVVAEPIPPRLRENIRAHDVPAITRNLVFLKEAIDVDCDDAKLGDRWRAAIQVLADVQSYAWGSAQRRAKLVAIAQTPHLLRAVQAAVVSVSPERGECSEFLAVLAVDGSDASADAMMPHVHHASTTGEGLRQLERLRTYAARSGPVRAMITNVENLLAHRSASSPPIELLKQLGIEASASTFWISFASTARRRGVPIVDARFSFDTRAVPFMRVYVARGVRADLRTAFSEKEVHCDGLKLGVVDLFGVPDFYERAARTLHIRWSWGEASVGSTLRGKKRDAVIAWLRGERIVTPSA